MSLEEKINNDLKAAMLAKDEATVRGLRAIKAAILLAKTEKGSSGTLTPEKEIALLQKLIKQRKESIEIFEKENRHDLATKEKEEVAVIEKYLPAMMSEEEVREKIKQIIAETGASSAKDMGKVMGAATKAFAGRADNKLVADIVKSLLQG
ncbi:MAG: GatB/YqeY domain-containing protein [Chitinophagales bacterium]|nr:GatB/YqeY domain-containing protein [Chitinophagales bacterium]MDW8274354.1 GatB/YqeY domain-containing protein [Chitinophagales bacterium]